MVLTSSNLVNCVPDVNKNKGVADKKKIIIIIIRIIRLIIIRITGTWDLAE